MRTSFLLLVLSISFLLIPSTAFANTQWPIQSIDTMKYSRDQAQIELNDPSFDRVIDQHMKNIADSGANYVAIDTPYDEEFFPFLQRWVSAARRYHLHVWFRGNLSGWEGWFGYPKIGRDQHVNEIKDFILRHSDIFENGDIFNSCPECENGGSGYPTTPTEIAEYRTFLIKEYHTTQQAFASIHKNVRSNFFSMNGDLAKQVMDKATTSELGGIVTIDHYVKTPEQLSDDIDTLANQSGGKIVLGEVGAPIPDIHGSMTEDQQAQWVRGVLQKLSLKKDVLGMNYWVDVGGTTALWRDNGTPKQAEVILGKFYSQKVIDIKVIGTLGQPIAGARVTHGDKVYTTNSDGHAYLPYLPAGTTVLISASDYESMNTQINKNGQLTISLNHKTMNWWERFLYMLRHEMRL